ncbi:MAG: sigma-70 family RNA polymerase sigma factor [Ilumatobacteraceae bacterium]
MEAATSPSSLARADDQALVTAAQGGDRRALDELLRRHIDRIHSVCARIVGGTRDADDATQNAMISIVRSLDRFDGRAAFSTWAYRIATNAALDELRRRKRRPNLQLVDEESGGTLEPTDPLSHRQVDAIVDRMAIDDALASLPADFRAAVVLCDVSGLGYAEIADVLAVPLGTVKSRIARGRAILVEMLGNHSLPGDVQSPSGHE